jgi:hypothetical protein
MLLLEGGEANWQATGVRREALQGAPIATVVFYGLRESRLE